MKYFSYSRSSLDEYISQFLRASWSPELAYDDCVQSACYICICLISTYHINHQLSLVFVIFLWIFMSICLYLPLFSFLGSTRFNISFVIQSFFGLIFSFPITFLKCFLQIYSCLFFMSLVSILSIFEFCQLTRLIYWYHVAILIFVAEILSSPWHLPRGHIHILYSPSHFLGKDIAMVFNKSFES